MRMFQKTQVETEGLRGTSSRLRIADIVDCPDFKGALDAFRANVKNRKY